LPNFYLQKTPDFTGFFIIKPGHPDDKKNRSRWKKTVMGAMSQTAKRGSCGRDIVYDGGFSIETRTHSLARVVYA